MQRRTVLYDVCGCRGEHCFCETVVDAEENSADYETVAMCLPPGVMKREAVVTVHDNVFILFLFLARYRTRLFFLAFLRSSVPAAPFKPPGSLRNKAQAIRAIFLSDNCC